MHSHHKREKVLQSGATIIVNREDFCYFKVGQELLQSGAGIAKWEHYYKVDQCKIKGTPMQI